MIFLFDLLPAGEDFFEVATHRLILELLQPRKQFVLFFVPLEGFHLRPHFFQQIGHAFNAGLGLVVETQLFFFGFLEDALLEDAERCWGL